MLYSGGAVVKCMRKACAVGSFSGSSSIDAVVTGTRFFLPSSLPLSTRLQGRLTRFGCCLFDAASLAPALWSASRAPVPGPVPAYCSSRGDGPADCGCRWIDVHVRETCMLLPYGHLEGSSLVCHHVGADRRLALSTAWVLECSRSRQGWECDKRAAALTEDAVGARRGQPTTSRCYCVLHAPAVLLESSYLLTRQSSPQVFSLFS